MEQNANLIDSDNEDASILNDYKLFIKNFKALYDDPHAQRHAQTSIRRLRQGKASAVSYSAKFRRLALDTGFDNQALIDIFRQGLNDDVKDVLASCLEEPEKLEEFIHFCIKIDNRLFDRKLERGIQNRNLKFPLMKTNQTVYPTTNKSPPAQNTPALSTGPVPMELDSMQAYPKKLSKEERQRRVTNNLCLYCGDPGHKAVGCPKKTKN